MKDPNAAAGSDGSEVRSSIPSHLKDLPPEELPEEHRTSVLSEIDKFRQASAAREEEKKRRDRVLEQERRMQQGGGWGPQQGGPQGPMDGPSRPAGDGRQSYNKPLDFVAQKEITDPVERDTEEEKERLRRAEEAKRKQAENVSALERADAAPVSLCPEAHSPCSRSRTTSMRSGGDSHDGRRRQSGSALRRRTAYSGHRHCWRAAMRGTTRGRRSASSSTPNGEHGLPRDEERS